MPSVALPTNEQVRANLCRYDSRNPASADLEPDEREPVAAPGCSCDNCFYGRHPLAAALLEARANRANFESDQPA